MFAIFSNKQPQKIIKRQQYFGGAVGVAVGVAEGVAVPLVKASVQFRGNMFDQIKGTSCLSCGK